MKKTPSLRMLGFSFRRWQEDCPPQVEMDASRLTFCVKVVEMKARASLHKSRNLGVSASIQQRGIGVRNGLRSGPIPSVQKRFHRWLAIVFARDERVRSGCALRSSAAAQRRRSPAKGRRIRRSVSIDADSFLQNPGFAGLTDKQHQQRG